MNTELPALPPYLFKDQCGPREKLIPLDSVLAWRTEVETSMRAYAAAAVAAERERCARICEQTDEDGEGPDCWGWHAKDYARAIRGQDQKGQG